MKKQRNIRKKRPNNLRRLITRGLQNTKRTMSIWHKPWFMPCGIRHILIVKTYAAVSASDDDAEMAVFLYREAAMRRVLGLMLFCFGIGMTLLLFIPETLSTLIFIIGCLTLGYYLFCG